MKIRINPKKKGAVACENSEWMNERQQEIQNVIDNKTETQKELDKGEVDELNKKFDFGN